MRPLHADTSESSARAGEARSAEYRHFGDDSALLTVAVQAHASSLPGEARLVLRDGTEVAASAVTFQPEAGLARIVFAVDRGVASSALGGSLQIAIGARHVPVPEPIKRTAIGVPDAELDHAVAAGVAGDELAGLIRVLERRATIAERVAGDAREQRSDSTKVAQAYREIWEVRELLESREAGYAAAAERIDAAEVAQREAETDLEDVRAESQAAVARLEARLAEAEALRDEALAARDAAVAAREEAEVARDEAIADRDEDVAAAEAERDRSVAAAQADRDQAVAAAEAQRDEAIAAAEAQRDEAIAAAEAERDAAETQRDKGIKKTQKERDKAVAAAETARDDAVSAAAAERDAAVAGRDEAVAAKNEAVATVDAALAAKDVAEAERDEAVATALAERDAVVATAQEERDDALAQRDEALAAADHAEAARAEALEKLQTVKADLAAATANVAGWAAELEEAKTRAADAEALLEAERTLHEVRLAAKAGDERQLADLFGEAQRERLRQTPEDDQRAQVDALERQLARMKQTHPGTNG